MVNVGYLALVRNQLSEAFAGEELAKRTNLLFKPSFHEFIARILITPAVLPPVVDEPFLLDLDKLGALLVQKSALRNRKPHFNPNVHFRRPGYAELLNHRSSGRVFLDSWKFTPEFRPEEPKVRNAKRRKGFKLDRKCNFNDGWIGKVGQPVLRFAHVRPCELALCARLDVPSS